MSYFNGESPGAEATFPSGETARWSAGGSGLERGPPLGAGCTKRPNYLLLLMFHFRAEWCARESDVRGKRIE